MKTAPENRKLRCTHFTTNMLFDKSNPGHNAHCGEIEKQTEKNRTNERQEIRLVSLVQTIS